MAQYKCSSGFTIIGPAKRYCETVMGQWSGAKPVCGKFFAEL